MMARHLAPLFGDLVVTGAAWENGVLYLSPGGLEGPAGSRVDDHYESWFGTQTLSSRRYIQEIDEGRYERERTYAVVREGRVYTENAGEERTTVDGPLDDGSFVHFARTIPLVVGSTHRFNRHFRPDRNPVTMRVLPRERIAVPAGTFTSVVARPIVKTTGIFSEGGRAEI
jgi:hypothetical protein